MKHHYWHRFATYRFASLKKASLSPFFKKVYFYRNRANFNHFSEWSFKKNVHATAYI